MLDEEKTQLVKVLVTVEIFRRIEVTMWLTGQNKQQLSAFNC